MDLKDIEKIVKLMDTHGLTQFKLEQDETKLELKKGDFSVEMVQRLMSSSPPQMMSAPPQVAAQPGGTEAENSPPEEQAGTEIIKSPMVGTFYSAEKPESEPYVKVGDQVEPETTVCTIEAMKVFNEIKAEIKGEIVEVLAENGAPVHFDEPLFRVKTS